MAEVKIIISSTDQMKNFIFFLYKSGFQPTLEKDQSFYELLYKSIKEKKIYPVWLKEKNTSEFLKTLNTMYHIPDSDYLLSSELLKPTPEFAEACGKEYLTKNGLISKKMAYDFILKQVYYKTPDLVGDILVLTDPLQNLLKVNSGKIDKYELTLLINNLFNPS
jgi:hypothetical protein